ncbi:unnamed protein product [Echinostoma caproni]|uniref:Secreted protein n=1 Tax=Echinostoma caproni TaxID=27848 RepID=A0A183A7G4_9TREM|nr:unnamed protein product [Echinostoma caproni]
MRAPDFSFIWMTITPWIILALGCLMTAPGLRFVYSHTVELRRPRFGLAQTHLVGPLNPTTDHDVADKTLTHTRSNVYATKGSAYHKLADHSARSFDPISKQRNPVNADEPNWLTRFPPDQDLFRSSRMGSQSSNKRSIQLSSQLRRNHSRRKTGRVASSSLGKGTAITAMEEPKGNVTQTRWW